MEGAVTVGDNALLENMGEMDLHTAPMLCLPNTTSPLEGVAHARPLLVHACAPVLVLRVAQPPMGRSAVTDEEVTRGGAWTPARGARQGEGSWSPAGSRSATSVISLTCSSTTMGTTTNNNS